MASGASVEPKVTAAWRLDKLLDIQSGNLGAATSIFLKHERPWDIQLTKLVVTFQSPLKHLFPPHCLKAAPFCHATGALV